LEKRRPTSGALGTLEEQLPGHLAWRLLNNSRLTAGLRGCRNAGHSAIRSLANLDVHLVVGMMMMVMVMMPMGQVLGPLDGVGGWVSPGLSGSGTEPEQEREDGEGKLSGLGL